MHLKLMDDEGLPTVIANVKQVRLGRDQETRAHYLHVTMSGGETERHDLKATAYLLNDRGDTIDTFRGK